MSEVTADVRADRVTIETPPDPMYVGVVRLAATAISARHGFTLDRNEDLKLAVDEAVSLIVKAAGPDGLITSTFDGMAQGLQVTVESPAQDAPDQDSYGWDVLEAITDEVDAGYSTGKAQVKFSMSRDAAMG